MIYVLTLLLTILFDAVFFAREFYSVHTSLLLVKLHVLDKSREVSEIHSICVGL